MKHLALLILCISFFATSKNVQAEINVAPSLDWLVCTAENIVKGKVISVEMEWVGGRKFPASFQLVVNRSWKGQTADTITISGLPLKHSDQALSYIDSELLVFVKVIPTKPNHYTPVGISDQSTEYAIIPLFVEPLLAFKTDFEALTNQEELFTYITNSLIAQKDLVCEFSYLEIQGGFAFKQLYWGSSCFLIVPKQLYPEAKTKF